MISYSGCPKNEAMNSLKYLPNIYYQNTYFENGLQDPKTLIIESFY